MAVILTIFDRSPDGGKGLARDTRVRWALEEAGLAYTVRPLSFAELKESGHLARHPFGQIPTYEDGTVSLFESGAIVLHIAEHDPGLLPNDPPARARALAWLFAALNTVEPPILDLSNTRMLEHAQPWYADRLPMVQNAVRRRLVQLTAALGPAQRLDGAFSVGDLMMVSVLLRLEASGLLAQFPELAAYVARATARPAYRRAFAAQLAINAR